MAIICKLAAGPARPVSARAQHKTAIQRLAAKTILPAFLSAAVAASPALAEGVAFQLLPGSSVSNPVHLEFSVDGMTVRPAGDGLIPGTGHFHVIVDQPAPEAGQSIPFDEFNKHYGKGQTSADIELSPGKHTLVLQFANALHESYGPAYASAIELNVTK